jgi:hypothetical protein
VSYTSNLTALNKGLTPVHPEQDRINFAPKLAGDIRVLFPENGQTWRYLTLNHVYRSEDSSNLSIHIPELENTIWVVSEIEGWWNIPEPSIPNIERGFGDGSFDVAGRFLARDITIIGSVLITENTRTNIAVKSAAVRKYLLDAFNLTKRATWLIADEDNFKRAAYVRLSGRPNISTVSGKGRIDFSIGLRASDPIKYEWLDESISTGPFGEPTLGNGYNSAFIVNGSVLPEFSTYSVGLVDYDVEGTDTATRGYDDYGYTLDTFHHSETYSQESARIYLGNTTQSTPSSFTTIDNHGDTNVYCYFRILGPLYGPAVIRNLDTNQEMNILAPVVGSNQILLPDETDRLLQYLDIDTRLREVHIGDYVDGESESSSRGLIEPLTDWIYLQPGKNTIYFNDTGAEGTTNFPTLEIYWRSGWIG